MLARGVALFEPTVLGRVWLPWGERAGGAAPVGLTSAPPGLPPTTMQRLQGLVKMKDLLQKNIQTGVDFANKA